MTLLKENNEAVIRKRPFSQHLNLCHTPQRHQLHSRALSIWQLFSHCGPGNQQVQFSDDYKGFCALENTDKLHSLYLCKANKKCTWCTKRVGGKGNGCKEKFPWILDHIAGEKRGGRERIDRSESPSTDFKRFHLELKLILALNIFCN